MADGGDHDVASMEGSGRGRRNFRRGAWRILGSGMEEFGIDDMIVDAYNNMIVGEPCTMI